MTRSGTVLYAVGITAIIGIGLYAGVGAFSDRSVARPDAVQNISVPVATATAKRQDVPEFVEGIGTVQAYIRC